MGIAFLGFGEVAGTVAPALAARGCEVAAGHILIDNPAGVEKLPARTGAARVAFAPGDATRG